MVQELSHRCSSLIPWATLSPGGGRGRSPLGHGRRGGLTSLRSRLPPRAPHLSEAEKIWGRGLTLPPWTPLWPGCWVPMARVQGCVPEGPPGTVWEGAPLSRRLCLPVTHRLPLASPVCAVIITAFDLTDVQTLEHARQVPARQPPWAPQTWATSCPWASDGAAAVLSLKIRSHRRRQGRPAPWPAQSGPR